MLIKIGNTELTHIRKYKIQRNKLWTDADRNMAGELRSTFVGVFPKIIIEFGYLTTTEMATLIGLLDTPSFEVTWYDEGQDDLTVGTYYAGDYELSFFNVEKELYEPMTVNLIPFTKVSV